ncbi:MAG: hypothetical protein RLZZ324_164 [Candidatus Parcubacteria bacterium]|jgi:uncharacterized protein YndB with AHSA1/START domain
MEDIKEKQIEITRVIAAPRERVFAAWTDPVHIAEWWGPEGFTTTTKEFELRVGGVWRHVMRGPDGKEYPNKTTFTAIEPPSRLAYTLSDDDAGTMKPFDAEILFDDEGGKTRVTLRMTFADAEQKRMQVEDIGAIEGGNQTLGRLEKHLNG